MSYEEIRLLKQSKRGTVYLVSEKDTGRLCIRKQLQGRYPVYELLQSCPYPFLPQIYEVTSEGGVTTVVEEYIEGCSPGGGTLPEKQLLKIAKELCSVLTFLHEKGIIHRDIKPSNIILAKDGHIRLIDFDAARMLKEDLKQDTELLGTRGYAPPEQYGFAQTDGRTDIYALGVTLKQLLGNQAGKWKYRRIIRKCTQIDPDRRYSSPNQVKRALMLAGCRALPWGGIVLAAALGVFLCFGIRAYFQQERNGEYAGADLIPLSAPENPHWDGETGIGVWGNVPESGVDGEVAYAYRLYRRDTETPPDPVRDEWDLENEMWGNGGRGGDFPIYQVNMSGYLQSDGYYYFAVCARGDGVHYADSPYVMSDAFEYTGETAPYLPAPTGLSWNILEGGDGPSYYATIDNYDDYAYGDSFNVFVYDKSGNYVTNNIWTKEEILSRGQWGIWIDGKCMPKDNGPFRFTVQVYTSRPNEYRSTPIKEKPEEEDYSPWLWPEDSSDEYKGEKP